MSNKSDEMKYEGLAALIVTQHEADSKRMDDFQKFVDKRFTGLEEHNRKQNGRISKTMEKLQSLEEEAQERKLTCGAAVKTLQKEVKYTKFVLWVDKHWKAALIMLVGILLVTQAIVHTFVQRGWLQQLWDLIRGVT